jgi:hypothetical protein
MSDHLTASIRDDHDGLADEHSDECVARSGMGILSAYCSILPGVI